MYNISVVIGDRYMKRLKLSILLIPLLLVGCTNRKVVNTYDNCDYYFNMESCVYVITYERNSQLTLSVDDVHYASRWNYNIKNTLYCFNDKSYEFIIFEGILN